MTGRVRRRLPRYRELRSLLPPSRTRGPRETRRVARAAGIGDLREIARRRMPRAVFDYVDGAAESETSLHRARAAFDRVEFHPRVLRDVSAVDPSTSILGRRSALPLAFAPTGFTRMMHHDGEVAVARVAVELGIPYALSTMGTTSVDALPVAVPGGDLWFQLYVWRDRARSKDLVDRAREAGYRVLMVTVDVPVPGARLRDTRNGMTIPPSLTVRTLADIARHPRYWCDLLTTEPLTFASLGTGKAETLAELVGTMFDPAVEFDDLEWMRSVWDGPLVVKGVQTVADAVAMVDCGVDAVVVSNHGGRQLDRAATPLEVLPAVVDAVGERAEVLLDSGVRSGADVCAAVALGARACLVGRAYLYGLMAGGEAGVRRAGDILAAETRRTMQLLGARTVDELTTELACLRPG